MLEEGAEAEVWERYVSADEDSDALFNGVTELIVGPGANLRYVCGQDLSERSWVFASQRAEVARDANLDWVALGFGSANGKVRMETSSPGAAPARGSPAPTSATAASTSTTTRRRSTRPRTRPPTSRSGASSTAARPRSGAG